MTPQSAQALSPDPQSRLDRTVAEAAAALGACQRSDGHWLFELEADCTIPAEYVMLGH